MLIYGTTGLYSTIPCLAEFFYEATLSEQERWMLIGAYAPFIFICEFPFFGHLFVIGSNICRFLHDVGQWKEDQRGIGQQQGGTQEASIDRLISVRYYPDRSYIRRPRSIPRLLKPRVFCTSSDSECWDDCMHMLWSFLLSIRERYKPAGLEILQARRFRLSGLF